MAESPPKQEKTKEELYNEMGSAERWANLWIDFLEARGAKSIARSKARQEKKEKEAKEKYEHQQKKQEIKYREKAAANLGATETSALENTEVIEKEKKDTVEMSLARLLLATMAMRSRDKLPKRWEQAQKTLKEPFTPQSLKKLFLDIGKGMK